MRKSSFKFFVTLAIALFTIMLGQVAMAATHVNYDAYHDVAFASAVGIAVMPDQLIAERLCSLNSCGRAPLFIGTSNKTDSVYAKSLVAGWKDRPGWHKVSALHFFRSS